MCRHSEKEVLAFSDWSDRRADSDTGGSEIIWIITIGEKTDAFPA